MLSGAQSPSGEQPVLAERGVVRVVHALPPDGLAHRRGGRDDVLALFRFLVLRVHVLRALHVVAPHQGGHVTHVTRPHGSGRRRRGGRARPLGRAGPLGAAHEVRRRHFRRLQKSTVGGCDAFALRRTSRCETFLEARRCWLSGAARTTTRAGHARSARRASAWSSPDSASTASMQVRRRRVTHTATQFLLRDLRFLGRTFLPLTVFPPLRLAGCGQLDFLPFQCRGCAKTFCLEHRASHGCAAPARQVRSRASLDDGSRNRHVVRTRPDERETSSGRLFVAAFFSRTESRLTSRCSDVPNARRTTFDASHRNQNPHTRRT